MAPRKPVTEESAGVTHVNLSRSQKRVGRRKRETTYNVTHSVIPDTLNELATTPSITAPFGSSSNINNTLQEIPSVGADPVPSRSPFHSTFFNDDGFAGPASDFPSSEGPELFNGLIAPDDALNDNDVDAPSPAEEEFTHQLDARSVPLRRVRRTALEQWISLRQRYLERLMEHEAKGTECGCLSCGAELETDGRFRCSDCFIGPHLCSNCMVIMHRLLPFHRIEKWNLRYWEDTTLIDLGLTLHLYHYDKPCAMPLKRETMTILHINGFHHVNVVFCGCGTHGLDVEPRDQLLLHRLYPASTISPSTAFTHSCLDIFLLLSSQSSISAYDFYQSMRQVTDNIDANQWPKRYDEFAHVVRCYRHLKMLKRGGRCHDPKGVLATQAGDLAVGCAACPHPGKNLRKGYENAPYWKQFLYESFWSMDADFRMKRKDRGTRNPLYLAPNWGYFVHPDDHEHERQRPDAQEAEKEERNTCDSTFAAVERANSKGLDGYAVTGVGAVICSRHGIFAPSVVNLMKGERQLDMDLSVLACVSCTEVENVRFRLTYDIACRYGLRLWNRIPRFAPKFSGPALGRSFTLGVPKFHLPGHGRSCQSMWSLNFRRGWARTDGEGIERFWSTINRFATATREMTSGNRHDFLDYAIGASNFRKLCGLGTLLYGKLKDAVEKVAEHSVVLQELEEACSAEKVETWKKQVDAWQNDQRVKPDPYQDVFEATTSNSVAQLRKELAREDASALAEDGSANVIGTGMTASAFMLKGLELEAAQHALKASASKTRSSQLTEEAKVEERRTSLLRKIRTWVDTQSVHMPHAFAYRHGLFSQDPPPIPVINEDDGSDDGSEMEVDEPAAIDDALPGASSSIPAEDYQLYLPSGLPDALLQATNPEIVEMERRIRLTVLESTFHDLLRLLRVKMGIFTNKKSFVVGQKGNTRAQKLLASFTEKIENTAERYRHVRVALLRLDPQGTWTTRLQELKKVDVRMPHEDEDPDNKKQQRKAKKRRLQLGEGSKKTSWIWRVSDAAADDPDADSEAMRVEWAKADARVERWIEEKDLVLEEMYRTPWYLDWKARWWEEQAYLRTELEPGPLRDGLAAYASKQAAVYRTLARKFISMWTPLLAKHNLTVGDEWPKC